MSLGLILGSFGYILLRSINASLPFIFGVIVGVSLLVSLVIFLVIWWEEKLKKRFFKIETEPSQENSDHTQNIQPFLDEGINKIWPELNQTKKDKLFHFIHSFVANILWFRSISWLFKILLSLGIALGGLLTSLLFYNQNNLLSKQNDLLVKQTEKLESQNNLLAYQNNTLELQNSKMDIQNNLEEANRRGSLVFLMNNIFDKIDEEIKDPKNDKRTLSSELIGRIIALSQAFKPYKYFEEGNLLANEISPERGQLLITLMNSDLNESTYKEIYDGGNFQYSDLKNSNFSEITLKNIDLSYSNLKNSEFRNTVFHYVNLSNSDMTNCHLSRSEIIESSLIDTKLDSSTFYLCALHGTKVKNENWLEENKNLKRFNTISYNHKLLPNLTSDGEYYLVFQKEESEIIQYIRCRKTIFEAINSSPDYIRYKQAINSSTGYDIDFYTEQTSKKPPFPKDGMGMSPNYDPNAWSIRLSLNNADFRMTQGFITIYTSNGKMTYSDGSGMEKPTIEEWGLAKNMKSEIIKNCCECD